MGAYVPEGGDLTEEIVAERSEKAGRGPVKRLYEWVMHWAETPYGPTALTVMAFCESSFFPLPPDILLIALGVSRPKKALYYALLCSVGSVFGGLLGYYIGYQLFQHIGMPILEFYGAMEQFHHVQDLYRQYDYWAISIAGFTPIPYKVFTITAGVTEINLAVFVVASAVSRSARFFLVGGLIRIFGPSIRDFIDRYLNVLSIIFVVLLVGGFILIKYIIE
jgi:membrane protein YqaA with SNARE-associated domain